MSNDIVVETQIVLKALVLGAGCCFLYDILRIFRRLLPRGSVLTGIEDVIFWIVNAMAIFVFMYNANGGIVRAYIIVFMILGMIIWEKMIGRFVVQYVTKLIRMVWDKVLGRMLRFIFKIVYTSFLKKIIKMIHKVLKKIVKPFKIQKKTNMTETKNRRSKRGAGLERQR